MESKIFLMHNVFNFMIVNTEFQTNMSQQKQPSASDTPQDPLIKCPNDSAHKRFSKVRHTSRRATDKEKPKQYFVLKKNVCLAMHWWT